MPKYRDNLTGKIVELDDEGKEVKTSETPTTISTEELAKKYPRSPDTILNINKDTTIAPSSAYKSFLSQPLFPQNKLFESPNIGSTIRNTLNIGGGLIGATGGLGGSFAGSFAGDIAGQGITGREPNPEEALQNSLLNIIPEIPLRPLFGGIGRKVVGEDFVNPEFKANLVQRFLPKILTKERAEDIAALNAYPEFQPSVGQQTGSKLSRFLEGVFAAGEKAKRENQQENALLDIIGRLRRDYSKALVPGGIPTRGDVSIGISRYGQKASEKALGEREILKRQENSSWNVVNQIVDDNTTTVNKVTGVTQPKSYNLGVPTPPPKITSEPLEIRGPVLVNNGLAVYDKEHTLIDKLLSNEANSNLPPWMQRQYSRVNRALENIVKPTKITDGKGNISDVNVKDFNSIKEFRTAVGELLAGKQNLSNDERILLNLSNALDKDVEFSMSTIWKKNGQSALIARDTANRLTQERYRRFNDEQLKILRGDKSQMFNEAFKTKENAERFMDTMGLGNEGPVRGAYFEHLIDSAFDPDTKKINPTKIIAELQANDSPAKTILTGPQRANIERFARAYKNVSDKDSNLGKYALWFRLGNAALSVGAGVLTYGATGSASISGATGAMTLAVIPTHLFAEKILMDPKYAKIASRSLTVPAGSAEAKYISKALLGALKGSQIILEYPASDGSSIPVNAIVNKDSKIQPLINR